MKIGSAIVIPESRRAPTRTQGTTSRNVSGWLALACLSLLPLTLPAASSYETDVQPLLKTYCYDCHGDGVAKGQIAFDAFPTVDELIAKKSLWLSVSKNLEAGLMPPEKKPKPSPEETQRIQNWIKRTAFGIDPENPDPGRVTLRRLNRVEYRNTIRDLTGFALKIEDELPPDDTGYGFDNIGDVLSLSPLLLEKYMQLAEKVANGSAPRKRRVPAEATLPGNSFRKVSGKGTADRFPVYEANTATNVWEAAQPGTYQVVVDVEVLGQFNFDPGKTRLKLLHDTEVLGEREYGWQNGKKFSFDTTRTWTRGPHALALTTEPLTPLSEKTNAFDVRVTSVRVRGPMEENQWVRPENFDKFFWQDPPESPEARADYARQVLARFVQNAYRRPSNEATLDKLLSIAQATWSTPGKSFEDGIAQALVPVLASPRFLFRVEATQPGTGREKFPPIDEHALATRLSYFLWSTTPDEELARLADQGQLRKNLSTQIRRLIADKRSDAFVENFTGQWLQVRDLDGIDINARVVLARDRGEDIEMEARNKRFQELIVIPEENRSLEQKQELQGIRDRRRAEFSKAPPIELDGELRRAMRDETQMAFASVLREDRSLLELITSDETFLNERLARHYGLTNAGVQGPQMRRVKLPPDSPRGGILTHGSFLVVSSNPTRTSPVKRGLFLLDNILGTPAPPAPANVPALEDAEKQLAKAQPTLRETLEFHRKNALCFSCHNRMDPLGLALENFNALGMWRDTERGHPIDPAGTLVTGESFKSIHDLKHSLATRHRADFYRCLVEKILTYATGRGLEYYDTVTVDAITQAVEASDGRLAALIEGVVQSAPFQRTRVPDKTRAGL